MLNQETINKMINLKLYKMAESLKERLSRSDHASLSHEDFVGFLIDDEYQDRQNKKLSRNLKKAKFKEEEAAIENIDYQFKRNLDKQVVLNLSQNAWVRNHYNILFTGPTGVGKSYLAQALGNNCCRKGYSVIYMRFSKLLDEMRISRADGTYQKYLKEIAKSDVLILDDLGMTSMDDCKKQDLFEIIEERHKVRSTIITSQLSTGSWHKYFGGGIIADAICDRILGSAVKIELKGDSLREESS